MLLTFRSHTLPDDAAAVKDIVESTGFFNEEEILVAVELVEERLGKGIECGYHFLFCETEGASVAGYTCFGPIPGTRSSFDLYWIAVHAQERGQGIGSRLIEQTETAIAAMGGTRIYIETSSRGLYKPTQGFYLKHGYTQEAIIKDFYAPGDSKIIYTKVLVPQGDRPFTGCKV